MASSSAPEKVALLLAHATDCRSRLEHDSALKFLEKAVAAAPDNSDVLDMSGECLLELGRTDEALAILRRSVELKPEEGAAKYMNIGQIVAGPESLASFEKGIGMMLAELYAGGIDEVALARLKFKICSGYCSVCELWMTDLCDDDAAEAKCEQVLGAAQALSPDSPELHVQFANLRMCQCRNDDAKKFTYRAVKLSNALEEADRPSLECRTGMLKLLIELEQEEEAEEFAQALLDVDDEYVETWYLLALLAFNKKEYHEAKRCTDTALKILTEEGIHDEEQAERVDALAEEVTKLAAEAGADEEMGDD